MQVAERCALRNGELPQSANGDCHEPVRLNIGAGVVSIPGFTPIDRSLGSEAFPLNFDDNTVDEILASHVLEHFSHLEVGAVLENWIAKLKPGGRIRIAVPDFERIAKSYLAGDAIYVQGFVMGGHKDGNDHHGCLFDAESLEELMLTCGLERVGRWTTEEPINARWALSLNLQGFKPSGPTPESLPNVRAIMSVPRFGPLMHPRCAEKAFFRLGIQAKSGSSCFWHQKLSDLMEEAIADPKCDFVLTMDFDTIFSAADVLELYRLMQAKPEADAIFPLQSKRGCEQALFSVTNAAGHYRTRITNTDLNRVLLPAATGHFGLTLLRADSLRKFPRPWMVPEPSQEGKWDGTHRDVDIDFWRRFRAAGFNTFLAPQIVVGHLEEVVKWPGQDIRPVYQDVGDYETEGMPPEVVRG